MKKFIIIFALSTIVFAFAGCNSCNQRKTKEQINISAVLPLTGLSANIGKWQENAIELAIDEYNSNSKNENKVTLRIEDSQGDPKIGLSAFQKLTASFDSKAFLISLSGVANTILPKLNDEKRKTLLLAVSLPNITEKSEFAYRFNLGSEDEAIAMSEYLKKNNFNTISVVYLNDEFGVGALNSFKGEFQKNGGTILITEAYTKEQNDFKSLISKINTRYSNGIYVIGYVPSSVECIKQMRQLGVKNQIFANMALSVPSFIKLGGDALNGAIYTVTNFSITDRSEVSRKFVNDYKLKYNEDPTFFSGFAYDAVKILLKDLSDSKNFDKPIQVSNYIGVMGKINLKSNRNFEFPIKIVQNQNGKIVDLTK